MEGVSIFGRKGNKKFAPNSRNPPTIRREKTSGRLLWTSQIEQIDNSRETISNQFLLLLLSVGFGFLFYWT
jgi:hypothetical protein